MSSLAFSGSNRVVGGGRREIGMESTHHSPPLHLSARRLLITLLRSTTFPGTRIMRRSPPIAIWLGVLSLSLGLTPVLSHGQDLRFPPYPGIPGGYNPSAGSYPGIPGGYGQPSVPYPNQPGIYGQPS